MKILMRTKVYIRDYSRNDLTVLLEECFFIIGKSTRDLEKFHIETMINGIIKYNGSFRYDDFKEAFEMYAAGELDVKIFSGASPILIGSLMKAYKEKKYPAHLHEPIKNASPHGLPPATDKDFYETLICIMEGRRSERHKQAYPHISDYSHLVIPIVIPMSYAWDNVYRHLRVLKQVDEANGYNEQYKAVKLWLYTKYPNATEQRKLFPLSKTEGPGLGSRLGNYTSNENK